jgi:hypothetical protein
MGNAVASAFGDEDPSMQASATVETSFEMKVTRASPAKLERDPSRRLTVYNEYERSSLPLCTQETYVVACYKRQRARDGKARNGWCNGVIESRGHCGHDHV